MDLYLPLCSKVRAMRCGTGTSAQRTFPLRKERRVAAIKSKHGKIYDSGLWLARQVQARA